MDTPLKTKNIAVIAHVDHGKTTLVDALLKQSHVFRENEQEMFAERILDTNELEREKGITIMAKIASISYQGYHINIIDTPGHADFSGEVERTLGMADGALLIIDAQEGPMPQTRFVLKKALELGLKVIVVINKIDKENADIKATLHKVDHLFLDTATQDDQLNFPTLYSISRLGKVFDTYPTDLNQPGNVVPLLNKIVSFVPSPSSEVDKPFKMLISALDYNPHLGKIVIGRISQGKITTQDKLVATRNLNVYLSVSKIMTYQGLSRVDVNFAPAGEIVAIAGLSGAIGDTLTDPSDTSPLPSAKLSEPTLHMTIGPNTSPFNGQEGEFHTARQIESRLEKEVETNISLKVEKLENGQYQISGKGELHLAILLESLRREGYEMEVGKPEVIYKSIDGQRQEPVEEVSIIVPNNQIGTVSEELGKRQAKLIKMEPITPSETEFIFHLPTRNIIGLRSLLLTATKGTSVLNSQVISYQAAGEPLPKLRKGVLIASDPGSAVAYGLRAAQNRGSTFVEPGTPVYEGMIIGENSKDEDIEINVTKGKHLSNMRSKGTDGIIQLAPSTSMSLEQCLDFLEAEELLEITPKSLRLRKKYLSEIDRRRHTRSLKNS